jgi:hypothetical protein
VFRFSCCALVIVSFAIFASDQVGGASRQQVAALSGAAPATAAAGQPAAHESQPRRFIDGAAHALTAPFRAVINSGSQWVQRGFATICALLLYGLGLGYLARYSQGST